MSDSYSWHFCRCWQQVVHKAGIDDLSIFIIDYPLKEGTAYALSHTAMHLSLDNHGIDHSPTIVDCHVFYERDHSCDGIDFDNGSVHATGKARVRGAVKLGCLQTWSAAFRWQGGTWPWACY